MSGIRLKQVDQISRKSVSDVRDSFLRHCLLKNLAPHTYTYYKENLQFFFVSAPQVKFVLCCCQSIFRCNCIIFHGIPVD